MGCILQIQKKNPDAQFIPEQTYEEAEEASRRGAFVIQADCIEPAKIFGIPIFLRNCFNLDCPGTRIGNPLPKEDQCLNHDPLFTSSDVATEDHLLDSIQNQNQSNFPSCAESGSTHFTPTITEEPCLLEIIV